MMRCTRCWCTSNSLTYDNRRRLCRFSVSGQASQVRSIPSESGDLLLHENAKKEDQSSSWIEETIKNVEPYPRQDRSSLLINICLAQRGEEERTACTCLAFYTSGLHTWYELGDIDYSRRTTSMGIELTARSYASDTGNAFFHGISCRGRCLAR